MLKVAVIFGTRPEAIKMAPVVKELQKKAHLFQPLVIVTAQHRQMLDQVLKVFAIKSDYDLNIMQPNQKLDQLTSRLILKVSEVLKTEKPDVVLVQGDTTTTLAAALAAFYQKITVGHIEAGLRSWQKYHPFPEEINRKLVSQLAELHFAPTLTAKNNLLNEGVPAEKVHITGNTVIDALLYIDKKLKNKSLNLLPQIKSKKFILVTTHRRENLNGNLKNICQAILELKQKHKDTDFVFSVHLNPAVQEVVQRYLKRTKGVYLTKPLDYFTFVQLMSKAHLILTDSGGIQEEAPALGRPVLVLREVTERPEGIKAGTVRLAGTRVTDIVTQTSLLLTKPQLYQQMAKAVNPYGDGKAAQRVVRALAA
jgi:UDP-N-acetylglucosamine 2-epimerase (non-hydrolysing)